MSEDVVSYVAIEAHNTWTNFARAYYFSCFVGTRLTTGAQVETKPKFAATTLADAQGWAINRFRTVKHKKKPDAAGNWNARDEPPWHKTDTIFTLCQDLDCSNGEQIASALSSKPTVLADLPNFRHFFAHRNRHTEAKALQVAASLGLPTAAGPAAALTYRPPTVPKGTLAEWLSDLQAVVRAMCS
jgi:hypothetical protein